MMAALKVGRVSISSQWIKSAQLIHLTFVFCMGFQLVLSQNRNKELVHFGPNKNGTEPKASPSSVVLGGLMNIHTGRDCNRFQPHGFQRSMAMAYAVEMINNNTNLLPGVKLCYEIYDTCSDRNTALRTALSFLPMEIEGGGASNGDESGIVGPALSVNSMAVTSIAQLFAIPQISYASTAQELGNSMRYPYFFRTVPSDGQQTEVIAALVRHFGWSYVTIIYTDDDYGRSGSRLLRRAIERDNDNNNNNNNNTINSTTRCVALQIRVRPVATEEDYDEVIKMMLRPMKNRATATVIFGQLLTATGVLDAWERKLASGNVSRNVTWIASDAWSTALPSRYFRTARGMIGVQPATRTSTGFDSWFRNLSLDNTVGSPWFNEYWEFAFNCTLNSGRQQCSPRIRSLGEFPEYSQDGKVPFTIDAVLAFGYALNAMQQALCGENAQGLCSDMLEPGSNRVSGEILRDFLRNVSFPAESTDTLKFDNKTQSVESGYTIFNLQQSADGETRMIVPVGEWNKGELTINDTVIQWNTRGGEVPMSRCSSPCSLGQFRFPLGSDQCCWECRRCRSNEIGDGRTCQPCPRNQSPDETQATCVTFPVKFLDWSSPLAIVLLSLSGIGIVVVLVGTILYLVYWRTKVVKSTSRELTLVMIVGIVLCFAMTVVHIGMPHPVMCGIQRVGYGLCYTICFGALLLKVNRIHRIFNRNKNYLKPPRFITWHSQLVFVGLIVLFNIAIAIIWLVVEPPSVISLVRGREIELRCGYNRFGGPTVEVAFILLVLSGCVYFALRTRKVPCEYNETRFINITVFCVLVIWLAYVPIYYGTTELEPDIYITSEVVSGLLIASCTFIFLLMPKYYLLLVKKRTEVQTDLTLAKHSITLKPSSMDRGVESGVDTKDSGLDTADLSMSGRTKLTRPTRTENREVQTVFQLSDWKDIEEFPEESGYTSDKESAIEHNNNNNNNKNNNNISNKMEKNLTGLATSEESLQESEMDS